MKRVSRNLVFEIGRCFPSILPTLEWVSKNFKALVSDDASYIHTLLEDVYDAIDVREYNWTKCKHFLKQRLFFLVMHFRDRCFAEFMCHNSEVRRYALKRFNETYGMNWALVSCDVIFLTGGVRHKQFAGKFFYYNDYLVSETDMINDHCFHAL
jgi:hypothetical protein